MWQLLIYNYSIMKPVNVLETFQALIHLTSTTFIHIRNNRTTDPSLFEKQSHNGLKWSEISGIGICLMQGQFLLIHYGLGNSRTVKCMVLSMKSALGEEFMQYATSSDNKKFTPVFLSKQTHDFYFLLCFEFATVLLHTLSWVRLTVCGVVIRDPCRQCFSNPQAH